jgi:hypothetical protein
MTAPLPGDQAYDPLASGPEPSVSVNDVLRA